MSRSEYEYIVKVDPTLAKHMEHDLKELTMSYGLTMVGAERYRKRADVLFFPALLSSLSFILFGAIFNWQALVYLGAFLSALILLIRLSRVLTEWWIKRLIRNLTIIPGEYHFQVIVSDVLKIIGTVENTFQTGEAKLILRNAVGLVCQKNKSLSEQKLAALMFSNEEQLEKVKELIHKSGGEITLF